jgi:hypothetical protein
VTNVFPKAEPQAINAAPQSAPAIKAMPQTKTEDRARAKSRIPARQARARWPIALAAVYFLGGLAAWTHFVTVNAWGMGNIGVIVYVMPISTIGFAIGKLTGAAEFPLIPHGLDVHTATALYFFPSLILLTYLLGWRFPAIYRRLMDED